MVEWEGLGRWARFGVVGACFLLHEQDYEQVFGVLF